MERIVRRTNADRWIAQVFAAKAVEKGGVVRRDVATVEREVGRKRFEREVLRRGFHLVEVGGQYVVICNSGRMRLVT